MQSGKAPYIQLKKRMAWIWNKTVSFGESLFTVILKFLEHPFVAITPRFTLTIGGNTS